MLQRQQHIRPLVPCNYSIETAILSVSGGRGGGGATCRASPNSGGMHPRRSAAVPGIPLLLRLEY